MYAPAHRDGVGHGLAHVEAGADVHHDGVGRGDGAGHIHRRRDGDQHAVRCMQTRMTRGLFEVES
jgi:hypothetical protein